MPVEAVRLADQPFDAIAPHCSAMALSNAEPQARMPEVIQHGLDGDLAKLKTTALVEDAIKIAFAPNPLLAGETLSHFSSDILRAAN
jgi:hypothetical protein